MVGRPVVRDGGAVSLVDRGVVLRLAGEGALVTLAINAVGLVSPIFFTQVYDRVLTTGSVPTLLALTFAALVTIGLGAAFEQVRSVIFTRLGASIYVDLEKHAYRASHAAAVMGVQGRRSQPLDDLETVRAMVAGPLPGALLDLIFAPLLLAVLFLINVWIGLFALLTLVLMTGVTLLTQWRITSAIRQSSDASHRASSLAESHMRTAEAAAAMGYATRTHERWSTLSRAAVGAQIQAAAGAGGLTASARAVRSGAQIIVIAIAAQQVLSGAMTGGAIIAASILLGRLIAPIDALLGGWRQLAHARVAADRLNRLLGQSPQPQSAPAPKPSGHLVLDTVVAATPAGAAILHGVSFRIEPGESLAIVGPTGAGKSTLLRCMMGVHPNMSGTVRLGGVPLAQADRDQVGGWLGFLPQNADLAPGTIADNISRFGPAEPAEIQTAARAAGAETLIASLPRGFDTDVGEIGAMLSAGQRRRIALARALFGGPCLVCLDEPEAHLDRDGEIALAHALQQMKAAGITVVIAAHKPAVVANVDKVLVLHDGRVAQFGDAAEIFAAINPAALRRVTP